MTTAAAKRSSTRETLEALLVAGLFLLFVNSWVFRTFFIPSGSMEPTLLVGDHLVVNRYVYGPAPMAAGRSVLPAREPRRGDLVVFRSVERPREDLIKRLIALPGDVVATRDKQLILNGKRVNEPYVVHRDSVIGGIHSFNPRHVQRDQYGPFTVPAGYVFVMGDNRDESYDSRFWGPLPRTYLKGRASVIYWSFGGDPPPTQWQGAGAQVRHLSRTLVGFFSRTRWERTFLLPR